MNSPAVRHPGELRWETRLLALATLALTLMGIVTAYSAATYKVDWHSQAAQQVVGVILGGLLFLAAVRIDYHVWRRIALPAFVATIAGLVAIAVVAVRWRGRVAPGIIGHLFPLGGGAHRTIKLGVQIQLSEVARFTMTAWLAARVADIGTRLRQARSGFLPLIAVIGTVALLVYVEPSLSMAIALVLVGATVLFVAGARVPHLAITAIIVVAMAFLVLKYSSFRHKRSETFQVPSLQCATGEQACASLIGMGAGGVTGVGFGKGTAKLGHLSEAYSDMILSVVGEEWGLMGVSVVALCFIAFCWMGFRIARTARDPFGTYLAAGLTTSVAVVAFMHTAVVLRLMPTTGLTLPFMSVGRVSLTLYLFSAGVIVSVGRRRGRPAR